MWARVAADKLQTPLLLQIENCKLNLNAANSCLKAFETDTSSGKWKVVRHIVEDVEDTVALASNAMQNKLHRVLCDFENHLDDPIVDFYNTELEQRLIC